MVGGCGQEVGHFTGQHWQPNCWGNMLEMQCRLLGSVLFWVGWSVPVAGLLWRVVQIVAVPGSKIKDLGGLAVHAAVFECED